MRSNINDIDFTIEKVIRIIITLCIACLVLIITAYRFNSEEYMKENEQKYVTAEILNVDSVPLLWGNRVCIIALPESKKNTPENRITLYTYDTSYIVGDVITIGHDRENYFISSEEEKIEYEKKMKEQENGKNSGIEEVSIENTLLENVPEKKKDKVMQLSNGKVEVEYRYSIEFKKDDGNTGTVKCFDYKDRPNYYELLYQYKNTSGIAYVKKENCLSIKEITETEMIDAYTEDGFIIKLPYPYECVWDGWNADTFYFFYAIKNKTGGYTLFGCNNSVDINKEEVAKIKILKTGYKVDELRVVSY